MVKIENYIPEKHAGMLDVFLREVYPNPDYVMHSPRFLRWQYLENPFNETGEYTLKLVISGNEIIGQMGIIPVRVRLPDGGIVTGAYPVNLIVRKQAAPGFGALLMRDLLRTCDLVVNPGSSLAGLKICVGLGMRDAGFLHRYLRLVNPELAARLCSGDSLPPGLVFNADTDVGDATDSDRLPDRIPAAENIPFHAASIMRNRDYLLWRYQNHPAFDYRFLTAGAGSALLVYRLEAVLSHEVSVCRIVDYMGNLDALPGLINALTSSLNDQEIALVDFFSSVEIPQAVLENAGLVCETPDAENRFASLFQPLDFRKLAIRLLVGGKHADSCNLDVYVTKGDSDQDRPNSARLVENRA
ncbi:hypothetical protein QVG61_06350 [Thiohalobacter sp. IOR34]|uniref:hypothetical protein n=1 Tax=Thiohalobacter sp. IOR34 TaxID=3057176 RepID=UPI0025AFE9CC|nr:hypothetical protein [Thiohalobacter sp. IOR34]WJW76702.1 hypothetical protein QVG61_06350 [Thiohalobacter sp. IOR34]